MSPAGLALGAAAAAARGLAPETAWVVAVARASCDMTCAARPGQECDESAWPASAAELVLAARLAGIACDEVAARGAAWAPLSEEAELRLTHRI